MAVRDRPFFTDIIATAADFRPEAGAAYVLRRLPREERGGHVEHWRAGAASTDFVWVVNEEQTYVEVEVRGDIHRVALRSRDQLRKLWETIGSQLIYIDITSLRHGTWAPLLKTGLSTGANIRVVYVEPEKYRPSLTPTGGEIYDLSERIQGIAPIPGFASLSDNVDNFCFVPLLGFEGTRVSHLVEHVQPLANRTIPVVGVPGFSAEYPFATYLGNQNPLIETRGWQNVRFAAANSPFSLFYVLEDIEAEYPGHLLKIAPVGTKPHALGAVLFSLISSGSVELVYDHPMPRVQRTEGTARLLTYHISAFVA